MSDVRVDLTPQWRDVYDAMVAAGHAPLTRSSGGGARLDDEWVDGGGRQVGVQCAACAYSHRLGHARTVPIVPCDGHAGKVARLRERAQVAKEAWQRAERLAAEAEGRS